MRKKIQTPDNQTFNNLVEFLVKRKMLTYRAIAQSLKIKENRIAQIKLGSNAVSTFELSDLKKIYERELEDFEIVNDPDEFEILSQKINK